MFNDRERWQTWGVRSLFVLALLVGVAPFVAPFLSDQHAVYVRGQSDLREAEDAARDIAGSEGSRGCLLRFLLRTAQSPVSPSANRRFGIVCLTDSADLWQACDLGPLGRQSLYSTAVAASSIAQHELDYLEQLLVRLCDGVP